MKIRAYTVTGGQIEWDEPDGFNLSVAVSHWRSVGYIQAPNFYINMATVAFMHLVGVDGAKVNIPAGQTLQ